MGPPATASAMLGTGPLPAARTTPCRSTNLTGSNVPMAATLPLQCDVRKRPATGAAADYCARMSSFLVQAISPEALARTRSTGLDASGNPVAPVQAEGEEPLRCCLRNARPGEELILFGYEPPIGQSPYREIGAVFAHAALCDRPPDRRDPSAWRARKQLP